MDNPHLSSHLEDLYVKEILYPLTYSYLVWNSYLLLSNTK